MVLRGTSEAIRKGRELLQKSIQEALAQPPKGAFKGKGWGKRGGTNYAPGEDPYGGASGMAGESAGICKWYAAGFCRNRECRNGVHDSSAAQKAEAGWVAEAETQCEGVSRLECFNEASTAVRFPEVLQSMREWICEIVGLTQDADLTTDHFLFVTCGNWDVKTAMPRQCAKEGGLDDLRQLMCARWCNLKEAFRNHYKLSQDAAPTGMRGMLKRLRIPLSGQHHLGMDDVSNLAKIVKVMIEKEAKLEATGFQRPEGQGMKGGCFPSGPSKGGGKMFKGKDGDKSKGFGFPKGGKGKFNEPSMKGAKGFGKDDFGKGKAGKFGVLDKG
eukprot:CAMPEP_0178383942 /NCGR_PEP_ID=MMETSP0689_2-20121128/7259_1 /TAXON_ID=160604 /ORGANISM="Amphidinium massartii, Strain CS-259" /LENGTH=328 /DNA_ID=CAMNT_0020004173 /DNA_START=8 /DNA_END=989 /DNA_ORIENTATION=+